MHCCQSRARTVDEGIEIKRLGIIRQDEDTNQEAEVGKTSGDERLLRCVDGSRVGVIETDEQVRRHTHKLPEDVHLEDVGGKHQAEHRECEEAQESKIALKAVLSQALSLMAVFNKVSIVHVAVTVEVNEERDCSHHNKHHCRDRVEIDAQVD